MLRASEEELIAIALGLKDANGGVLQFVSDWDTPSLEAEFALVKRMTRESGRHLSYSLSQRHATPHLWKELLRLTRDARADGFPIYAQVAPRGIGVLSSLQGTINIFSDCPSYAAIASLPLPEKVAALRSPAMRERLLAEQPAGNAGPIAHNASHLEHVYRLGCPPNYEPSAHDSVYAIAQREGRSPKEVAYDMLLENEGRNFLFSPISNYAEANLDVCRAMLADGDNLIGLGDGGAHVSIISDASFPTFLLSYWGRDRASGRFELEWLVKRLTSDQAGYLGLTDRGVIAPGMKADLNIIDFSKLSCENPYMAYDLPAGGNRLLQKANGYVATILSGRVTHRDGAPTGALPGQLVRGSTATRSA